MAGKKTEPQTPPLLDYEWQVDGRPDGKLRTVGEPIKMTEKQAKYHLQMGALKLVQPTVKAPSKASQKPAKTTTKPAAGYAPEGDAASSVAPSKATTAK